MSPPAEDRWAIWQRRIADAIVFLILTAAGCAGVWTALHGRIDRWTVALITVSVVWLLSLGGHETLLDRIHRLLDSRQANHPRR